MSAAFSVIDLRECHHLRWMSTSSSQFHMIFWPGVSQQPHHQMNGYRPETSPKARSFEPLWFAWGGASCLSDRGSFGQPLSVLLGLFSHLGRNPVDDPAAERTALVKAKIY